MFEFTIANRHLRTRHRRGFVATIALVATLGVIIGVATLIVVVGIMTGFIDHYKSTILSTNAHVYVFTYYQRGMSSADSLLAAIKVRPEVRHVGKMTYNEGIVSHHQAMEGIIVRGIDLTDSVRKQDLSGQLISGSVLSPTDSLKYRPIYLGKIVAEKINAGVGSVIKLAHPESGRTRRLMDLKVNRFQVAGIVDLGMFEYNSTIVFLDLAAAQNFYDLGGTVTGLEIWLHDLNRADRFADGLRHELGMPYRTSDWITLNGTLFAALKIQKFTLVIILTLIVVVAAFNIISTLIMIVMEKKREIGVLKAMGAARRSIMKIFIIEGTLIGIVGTFLGAVAGFIVLHLIGHYQFVDLPVEIYQFDRLPIKLDFWDVVIIMAVTILITFLATIYPAWRAARLMPVDAIRYE